MPAEPHQPRSMVALCHELPNSIKTNPCNWEAFKTAGSPGLAAIENGEGAGRPSLPWCRATHCSTCLTLCMALSPPLYLTCLLVSASWSFGRSWW